MAASGWTPLIDALTGSLTILRRCILVYCVVSGTAFAQDRQSNFFPPGAYDSSRLIFFEVASQPLSDALINFALQGNLSIGLEDSSASRLTTNRLSGLYNTRQGLGVLLNGTGLAFNFVDSKTVRVFKAPPRKVVRQTRIPTSQPRPQVVQTKRRLEELIVTSTKREKDPREVPMSVATVTSERLESFQVTDTDDLMSLVAGLSSTNQGPGRNKIFLRGQSDGPIAERTQSTVGIYIDESPLVFSDTNPDFRLLDVERIEVLRGPQGTVFGAGSMGGTFRIISNKPDPSEIIGRVGFSGAFTNKGSQSFTSDAVLNVPLSDKSALRVTGFYDSFGGFIDDVRLGEDNVNDATIIGGRLSYAIQFGESWSALLTGNAQKIDLDDTQYYSPSVGLLERDNFVPEPRGDRFAQAGLTIEGDIGNTDFVSTTTYVNRRINNQSDASLAVPDLLGLSVRPSPFLSQLNISTYAQELRLAYTGKRLDWVVGSFFLTRTEDFKTSFDVPGAGLAFGSEGFPTDIVFSEQRDDDFQHYAVFADTTFALTRKVDIGFGARLSQASHDVTSLTSGVLSARSEETDIGNEATHFNPRVSVDYEASQNTQLYAQFARGFRVGGININTPISALFDTDLEEDEQLKTQTFVSDALWNFEIGSKSRFLDGRLSLDVAAFFVDWSNIQTDQILPTGFLFVTNAGDARNFGVELQVAAQLTDRWFVSAAAIWNAPELTEANTFLNAEKGDRLPAISAITLGLGLQYKRPIGSRATFSASFDYAYVGSSRLFFDRDASPEMGDYHRANVRAGLEWDDWQARLFANNVFNDRGNTFAFGNSFSLNALSQFTPLRPRTFGFEVVRAF